ncbi:hypothetical protein L249_4673 [Ophiocordyceps polyrhachis-furcata BCC 54312]|uniref:Major facilitator superfamily (MFS) profile domain-containing protein n=1 Tax=Ophiocordyceps polyrhachis-furcata BCC 54312 TaxID=1330021 RepID=A0A367L2Z9_9HYPO|nr:hypothetical protein L249_4673 [Ophiocordyceps polyrhachis-furcata BCC 54312]
MQDVKEPPGTVRLFSQADDEEKDLVRQRSLILTPTPSGHPDDALSWSMRRKCWHYGLLMAMTVVIFASLTIQPIFWTQMQADMDVSVQQLNNAQAFQLVGLAVGCILMVPFAKKYGRRPVYIVSTALVVAAAWWSAAVRSAVEVQLANFLMGLAGAVNETAVQMTIRDMFFVHQRGTANGIYLIAFSSGSFLVAIAVGAQAERSGWRAPYLTLAGFMTALCLLFIVGLEETKPVAVTNKDRQTFRPRLQLVTASDESLWKTAYQPLHTAWYPHVVLTSLEYASGLCWLVVLCSVVSVVFSAEPYNFNAAQVGFLMCGGPLVGSLLASIYGGYLSDWAVVRFARRNQGLLEPEMRLWLLPVPALLMSGGLALFGVTADRGMHWIYPSIGTAVFVTGFGAGMHWIYPSIGTAVFVTGFGAVSDITLTLVIDAYPDLQIVPLTFVVVAFFRNAISIAGPFSITPWMKVMSISGIFISAAVISFLVHLVAVPVVIWGKRIRTWLAPRNYRLSNDG